MRKIGPLRELRVSRIVNEVLNAYHMRIAQHPINQDRYGVLLLIIHQAMDDGHKPPVIIRAIHNAVYANENQLLSTLDKWSNQLKAAHTVGLLHVQVKIIVNDLMNAANHLDQASSESRRVDRPKSTRPSTRDMPSWANWYVQQTNGYWEAFEHKPYWSKASNKWCAPSGRTQTIFKGMLNDDGTGELELRKVMDPHQIY